MTDDRIATDIARAKRAALLIDDEMLKDAFATLEAAYIEHWKNATKAADTDARERIWMALQVVGKVQNHLHKVINDGVIAQGELEMMKAEQAAA